VWQMSRGEECRATTSVGVAVVQCGAKREGGAATEAERRD